MGQFKMPGRRLARGRFELRERQEWLDLVAEAARMITDGNVSKYIREAVNRQLARDGFDSRTPTYRADPDDGDSTTSASSRPKRRARSRQ